MAPPIRGGEVAVEFAPGGRTLLGIVIPTDHLSVPDEEPPLSQREKITLLALAAPGEAITVSVVLTAPESQTVSAARPLDPADAR
jgi:hypothetical protein